MKEDELMNIDYSVDLIEFDENETFIFEDETYIIKDLPKILTNQAKIIADLNKKKNDAVQKAKNSKEKVDNLAPVKFFKKKAAIEDLQDALKDTNEALTSTNEAVEVSFEYQKQLVEICKYLFKLGACNRAANRSVVRNLMLILDGASQEELDDLARQELLNVVSELNAQVDIDAKQDKIFGTLEEQEYKMDTQDRKLGYVSKKIESMGAKQNESEKILQSYVKKIDSNRKLIDREVEVNKKNSERILAGEKKDIDHEERIVVGEKKDVEQDAKLRDLDNKSHGMDQALEFHTLQIEELEGIIKNYEGRIILQEMVIEEQNKRISEMKAEMDRLNKTILSAEKRVWKRSKRGRN